MLIGAEIVVTLMLEIATPLTGLAMTEVVVTRLHRFEQSDNLKFKSGMVRIYDTFIYHQPCGGQP